MTKDTLRKVIKGYSVDVINEGMTYAYNDKGQIREVLTNKAVDALADLIIKENEKEEQNEN